MKSNLAKFKLGRLPKHNLKKANVSSFFYPMTEEVNQWLKKYYTLWTSFAGYQQSSVLALDFFRKAKQIRGFYVAFCFKNCEDALGFFDVLENPSENLENLGFLNFSAQEIVWQMQKIKFLFFRVKNIYFSQQLLRKELSLDRRNLFFNLVSTVKKQLFYRIAPIGRIASSFTQLFFFLFLLAIFNILLFFRVKKKAF